MLISLAGGTGIEPEIKLEVINKGRLIANTYTVEKRVDNIISLINFDLKLLLLLIKYKINVLTTFFQL